MAESQQSTAPGRDRVYVMPKQYVGARAEGSQAPSFMTGQKAAGPSKHRALIIILVVGLTGLLALAGWMVYLNYFQPTTNNRQPTTPVTPVVTTPVTPEPTPVTPTIPTPPVTPEPTPEPTTPPVETPTSVTIPAGATLSSLMTTDEDKDGLTDAEELLLGTKTDVADTDGDTFADGAELLNLYNPAAAEPALLQDSALVLTYVNPLFGYDVFYPKAWVARAVDATSEEVFFTSAVGEYVSVKVLDNKESLPLATWYTNTHASSSADSVVTKTDKNGTTRLISGDGFSQYIGHGTKVIEIRYHVGLKPEVSYPHIFEMIASSVVVSS